MRRMNLFLMAAAALTVLVGAALYGAGKRNTMAMAYAVCGVHESRP